MCATVQILNSNPETKEIQCFEKASKSRYNVYIETVSENTICYKPADLKADLAFRKKDCNYIEKLEKLISAQTKQHVFCWVWVFFYPRFYVLASEVSKYLITKTV